MTTTIIKAGTKVRIIAGGKEGDNYHNFKHGSIVVFDCDSKFTGNEYDSGLARGKVFYESDGGGHDDTQFIRFSHFEVLPAVDFTKPVFTAEGTPVEIITTAGRDPKFPVLAYEGKATEPSKFDLNGFSKMGVQRRNLTNEKPKLEETVVRYANVYRSGDGLAISALHYDRRNADLSQSAGRVGVAKVTVKLVEGEFAE